MNSRIDRVSSKEFCQEKRRPDLNDMHVKDV